MTLIILVNIFAISIIVLSFFDLSLSIACYVAYLILVPGMQVPVAGISFSYNIVNSILLLSFLLHFYKDEGRRLSFVAVSPFLLLFFLLLFLSLFQEAVPWRWQFNYWRGAFMQVCILSFIIWNRGITQPRSLVYIRWALFISILISGIYGIYLMQLGGENPYTSQLSDYFGSRDAADFYSSSNDPRLGLSSAGKIQSTMDHPMTWALILCFSFLLEFVLMQKHRNSIYWIFIALISFNILISGVRTAIAAIIVGLFYYLIKLKSSKLIMVAAIIVFCISIAVVTSKDLTNIFTSFIDVSGNKSNISGSSIAMRLDQFNGALHEMKGNEMVGKGYEWTSYYMEKYGDHPVLLSFESLIFIVLCNSGILGLLIWTTFFILLFRTHRKLLLGNHDIYSLDTMIIIYLSYTMGTGEYDYLKFFAIFYTYMLAVLYVTQSHQVPILSYRKIAH